MISAETLTITLGLVATRWDELRMVSSALVPKLSCRRAEAEAETLVLGMPIQVTQVVSPMRRRCHW